MKSTFVTLRLYIFGIIASLAYCATCGKSEYLSATNECCPMCTIGSVVLKDCHGDYSTTCKPCNKGTYMNEPNGLYKCFQCKSCDSGLSIVHDCTTIKDTVCDVSDGYYCIQHLNKTKECSLAMKHSQCKPGEQIKTAGTKSSDTVCEPCPPGFDSPDGVNCSKWTDSDKNKVEQRNPRTSYMRYGLIPFGLIPLVLIVVYLISTFKRSNTLKKPVEETSRQHSVLSPSSSQLETKHESPAVQPHWGESPAVQPDCDKENMVTSSLFTGVL